MASQQNDAAGGQISSEARGEEILKVFHNAFGKLLEGDPAAFELKFRKMAASAFAFYRGSACLFYHDLQHQKDQDPFLNDQTSQVWIHGDLHAENFGTYMGSHGRLVFNVNDFDEAYVGPFTWDLKRFAASIALIGYSKALSDRQISRLVQHYLTAYREQIHALATHSDGDESISQFTFDTATGPVLGALREARQQNRSELLNSMSEIRDFERHFTRNKSAVELKPEERQKIEAAFDKYLTTLPNSTKLSPTSYRIKDVIGRRGVGIGSAGLPSHNILLEGKSEALENDIVIYMKQSQPAAVSQYIPSDAAKNHFQHEGHRTVLSQRALQAHTDPWLGWTEIDGVGQLVAEVSPYAVDFEWTTDDPKEIAQIVADLGRATAMMHGAGDDDSRHSDLVPFSPEKAIDDVIAKDEKGFEKDLIDFAHEYAAQARRDHDNFVHLFRNGHIPGLSSNDE
jgi:uncharacterized protein (DUF2252 family)